MIIDDDWSNTSHIIKTNDPNVKETYNDTEAVISEVASDNLCFSQRSNKKSVLEIFDDGILKSPATSDEMCARLNGRLKLIPFTDEEAFEIIREFEDYAVKANHSGFGYWMGGKASMNNTEMIEVDENFQVYSKGGLWVISDPYTNNLLGRNSGRCVFKFKNSCKIKQSLQG